MGLYWPFHDNKSAAVASAVIVAAAAATYPRKHIILDILQWNLSITTT